MPAVLLSLSRMQGALGHPLIPTPEGLAALSADKLHAFVASHYTGHR